MRRGLAVGGPLHGQIITSSRPVEVALEEFNYSCNRLVFESEYLGFRKGMYRAVKLGVSGSSKSVTFWVYDRHSDEAAQAIAWEMVFEDFEKNLHRSGRRETRFP